MSLSEFIERSGTEAQCVAALEQALRPSGFVCPECGELARSTFPAYGRKYWQCAHCRTQTTARSGTLYCASKRYLTGANLKRSIRGTYHHFRFRKYSRRHLAEAQYRVNRRLYQRSLVGQLVYTCGDAAPCPEVWLRLGVARAG